MFVDNVAVQVIEEQLIETLPDLLSPPSIQNMSTHLVSRICAESAVDQYRRQELKRVLAILGKSLETCRIFSSGVSTSKFLSDFRALILNFLNLLKFNVLFD